MGRLLAGFLSFLVSIQLTVGQHTLVLVDTAQAQTCATGQKLDPIMGRCLSTEQASQVASATSTCASIQNADEQRRCYLSNAEAALADAEAKGDVKEAGEVKSSQMGMILTMGGLASSVGFLITGGTAKCGPFTTSAIIIAASSAAAMMAEILSASTYKKKMKEANETLKKINEGSAGKTQTGASSNVMNATNVQEEAFNALIKKEEAVIAAANAKKKLYTLAMAGYAAATVMAGIEVAKSLIPGIGAAATACAPALPAGDEAATGQMLNPNNWFSTASVTPKQQLIERYVENYFQKHQRVSFQTYLASDYIQSTKDLPSFIAAMVTRETLRAGQQQSISVAEYSDIQSALPAQSMDHEGFSLLKGFALLSNTLIPRAEASPIIAVGGTAAMVALAVKVRAVAAGMKFLYTNPYARLALAGVLTANAMATKAHAGKEADKAKDRITFLEKLRDQVTIAGNGVNCGSADAAQASAVCKSNAVDVITPSGATGANGLTAAEFNTAGSNDPSFTTPRCITNTGSFDSACSCKKNNTCLSISNSISGGIPSGVSLGSVPSSLDSVTNGKLAGINLNEADLTAQAARLNQMNDTLSKKNPAIAKANADAKKQIAQIGADLAKQAGSGPALAATGPAENSLTNAPTPEEALKQMKNELSQEINKVEGQTASASGTKSDLDLSGLDDAPSDTPAVAPSDKLAEVMASEYEMGNNDINTETSTSIFDIVSNRYKRSGIRRLLGSEQLIPADGAASSDINR